ncbi:MAG: hypothetical protein ACQEP7_01655 [bacterium]
MLLINATGAAVFLFVFNAPYLMLLFILAPIIFIFGLFAEPDSIDPDSFYSLSRLKSGGVIFVVLTGLILYSATLFNPPKQLPGKFAVDLAGGNPVQYLSTLFLDRYIIIIPLLALFFVLLYTGAGHLVQSGDN